MKPVLSSSRRSARSDPSWPAAGAPRARRPLPPNVTVFIGTYTRGWACPPQNKNTGACTSKGIYRATLDAKHRRAEQAQPWRPSRTTPLTWRSIPAASTSTRSTRSATSAASGRAGVSAFAIEPSGKLTPHQPGLLARRRPLPRLADRLGRARAGRQLQRGQRRQLQGRPQGRAARGEHGARRGDPRPPRQPGRRPRPLHRRGTRRPASSTSPTWAWTRCCSTPWTPAAAQLKPNAAAPVRQHAARQRPAPPGDPPQQEVPLHQQRAHHRGLGLRPRPGHRRAQAAARADREHHPAALRQAQQQRRPGDQRPTAGSSTSRTGATTASASSRSTRPRGKLTPVENVPSGGREPRDFKIDPSGKLLLVGHQNSDDVVVFRIDPATGKLKPAAPQAEGLEARELRLLVPPGEALAAPEQSDGPSRLV